MRRVRLVVAEPAPARARPLAEVVPRLSRLGRLEGLLNPMLETSAEAARRERLQAREVAALATIPARFVGELRAGCERYARLVVRHATAAELQRIVWPWTPRPARTSTPRGRQGVALAAR